MEIDGGREAMDEEQDTLPSQLNDRNGRSPGEETMPDSEKVHDSGKQSAVSISKKKRKEDIEAMDVETQRLLRESKRVAFPEGQLQQKPISSVLEKMRQRKLERAQRLAQQGSGRLGRRQTLDVKKTFIDEDPVNLNLDDDLELVTTTQQAPGIKQELSESLGACKSPSTSAVVECIEDTTKPSTPETQNEGSCAVYKAAGNSSILEGLTRPALINSQDLYSDSQLSPIRDEGADRCSVDEPPVPQLDSETQTDYSSSPAGDEEKQPARGNSFLVRGLVDDEAEDEDEDLLAADDEDEVQAEVDAAEELQDMLAQEVVEGEADKKRRDRLHRKWLEEQDSSLTDSIINRLENGWNSRAKKQRLPGILSEAENDSGGSKTKESTEEAEAEEEPAATPFEDSTPTLFQEILAGPQNPVLKHEASPGPEEVLESEDEEEDERLRRQRLLNESEEQSELPSVHDDESSRQILGLISKVNVATTRTTRVTLGLSDSRPISLVHSHSRSNVQCSFARRTVTSSHATTRQGSGNSRSYVFGRDDSSSNHGTRLPESDPESQGRKDSSASAAVTGDRQNSNSRISPAHKGVASGSKGIGGKALESTGPSLIQVLKKQAADLERSILTRDAPWSVNGSSLGDLSIFSVMRPSKSSRKSKA